MIVFNSNLILENKQLLLKPSTLDDLDGLGLIANQSIWEHSSTSIDNKAEMKQYLLKAIEDRQNQERQQLTITDKLHQQTIGCSSFENISHEHQRLEIGWTWLGKAFQGKGWNKVAKFLMVSYAFENLAFERVEFRARGTNIQSQKALAKIGATREGTLRSYFASEGKRHDFVYFSILKDEWPTLKTTVFKQVSQ